MGYKMKDDEELEKLFEQMSKEQVKMVVNQNSPSERTTKKETTLKRVRASKGFTQKSLAEATGISLRTIQHWEQGNIDFNQAAAMTVYKISQVLGVDMLDLLDIPEPEETKPIKVVCVEPPEYIPEDLRKEFKLGEYAEDVSEEAKKTD